MIRTTALAAIVLFALSGHAFAEPRSVTSAPSAVATQKVGQALSRSERPLARPTTARVGAAQPNQRAQNQGFGARLAEALGGSDLDATGQLRRSIRPKERPTARRVVRQTQRRAAQGAICNSRTIQGRAIAPIPGPGRCGIPNAVSVTAVAGVAIRGNTLLNCDTARALEAWVERGAKPAVGDYGGGLQSMRVVASYSCRTRNSQRGARLSEHSFGNAIDLAGFTMRDGTQITLLTDWKTRRKGGILKDMWRKACGPFGTVLGPESNRFHLDHFHFDIANRRNPYCR